MEKSFPSVIFRAAYKFRPRPLDDGRKYWTGKWVDARTGRSTVTYVARPAVVNYESAVDESPVELNGKEYIAAKETESSALLPAPGSSSVSQRRSASFLSFPARRRAAFPCFVSPSSSSVRTRLPFHCSRDFHGSMAANSHRRWSAKFVGKLRQLSSKRALGQTHSTAARTPRLTEPAALAEKYLAAESKVPSPGHRA